MTAARPPRWRLAILDFDGTLADSFPLFVREFNALADAHGFRRVAEAEIPALRALDARTVMRNVGLPAWKLPGVARDFVARMRAQRGAVGLFDGVADVLPALAARGVALAVVSSNARDTVEAVLGPALLAHVSHVDGGASIFGKRARIARVLRALRVPADAAIAIGDQTTDLEAARAAGVAAGAVAWGYGDLRALTAMAPDAIFERVSDLLAIA